jgi:hypothetical protein
MQKAIQEAADFTLFAQHHEKPNPRAWLKNVRKSDDQETDRDQFFN